jgi:hypothetical protein
MESGRAVGSAAPVVAQGVAAGLLERLIEALGAYLRGAG